LWEDEKYGIGIIWGIFVWGMSLDVIFFCQISVILIFFLFMKKRERD